MSLVFNAILLPFKAFRLAFAKGGLIAVALLVIVLLVLVGALRSDGRDDPRPATTKSDGGYGPVIAP